VHAANALALIAAMLWGDIRVSLAQRILSFAPLRLCGE
jgi:hypothetical protein